MALNAGNASCSTGMASRILAELLTPSGGEVPGFSGSLTTAQLNSLKALCYAFSLGIVAEIQANAAVTVTIGAATGGLQTSAVVGNPTTGPGMTVTLPGTVA